MSRATHSNIRCSKQTSTKSSRGATHPTLSSSTAASPSSLTSSSRAPQSAPTQAGEESNRRVRSSHRHSQINSINTSSNSSFSSKSKCRLSSNLEKTRRERKWRKQETSRDKHERNCRCSRSTAVEVTRAKTRLREASPSLLRTSREGLAGLTRSSAKWLKEQPTHHHKRRSKPDSHLLRQLKTVSG